MGLKIRCKQSEYCTWWGVLNVNIAYIVLWWSYGALHNAELNHCSVYS